MEILNNVDDNNYTKLTLTYKKIDLTVKIDFLFSFQIKNTKPTPCIQSSGKKARHSSLLPKN